MRSDKRTFVVQKVDRCLRICTEQDQVAGPHVFSGEFVIHISTDLCKLEHGVICIHCKDFVSQMVICLRERATDMADAYDSDCKLFHD